MIIAFGADLLPEGVNGAYIAAHGGRPQWGAVSAGLTAFKSETALSSPNFYQKELLSMLIELNRADCSRIHVALLEALDVPRDEPTGPVEASKAAFAEAVAFYSDNPSPSVSEILDAAHAVRSEIELETGGAKTPLEFDIASLETATGLNTQEAILVARLCGAMPFKIGGELKWKNSSSVVNPFLFPSDLMQD